jgi:C4-dicarboxylate transporter DctM subunit
MLALGLLIIVVLFLLGIPIWAVLTFGGIFLLIFEIGTPLVNIPLTFFGSIDSFTLMAITFFLLAGSVMACCGPSKYVFDVINPFFGRSRGGLAITSVVMCMVYAAITGSSTATLAGVAEVALPEMIKAGYSRKFCGGVLAASCTLGQMIPPSIYMIVYATMVQANAGVLFISGIIPGIICGIVLCIMAYFLSPQKLQEENEVVYSWEYKRKALLWGTPALLMPVIVLGGIYTGVVTPTEAGGIAIVYSVLISTFIYRTMTWDAMKRSLASTATSNSMIFILVAGALLFANPITFAQIPQVVSEYVAALGLNDTQLLFATALLFIVLGCFLDSLPILYLTVPILYPTLQATGVDVIHFNVVMILCMQIGQITPPFGMALYVAAGVCKAPVGDVSRESFKYLVAYSIILVFIILFPSISTFLPKLTMLK